MYLYDKLKYKGEKEKNMLAYVNGILVHKQEGLAVIDCNGVGYEFFISNNTLVALPNNHEPCKLHSYLQVKEDGIALFGFATLEEKQLFNKLITVSGIGPKGAISMLSGMSLTDLMVAIANDDVNSLSKIKGLGKKSAERICLELKDKIDTLDIIPTNEFNTSAVSEAVEVLVSLGINKNQALSLAKSVAKPDMTVEQVISLALQSMGK